jgi:hypothetical protein
VLKIYNYLREVILSRRISSKAYSVLQVPNNDGGSQFSDLVEVIGDTCFRLEDFMDLTAVFPRYCGNI